MAPPPVTEPLRRLAALLDVLLAPVEQLADHRWADGTARAFGLLFDDEHCAVLAIDRGGDRLWFGPGRDRPDCRLVADPGQRPAGVLTQDARAGALAWWYAGRAGDAPLGVGLWWHDPAARLRMMLGCRPARLHPGRSIVHASDPGADRVLLDLLRAPFAAAGRARAPAAGAPAPVAAGRREASTAALLARTSGTLAERLATQYGLTRRETEVIRLLLQGRSNASLAEELRISGSTARHHTERIISKLGVRSCAEVAWIAVGALATPPEGMETVRPPTVGDGAGSGIASRDGR